MRSGWPGRRVVGMYWRVMNEAWEYLFCDIVRNTAYTTGGRIRYLLVLLQDVLNEETVGHVLGFRL